jgi:alpha-1,3-mannosyl-glycoprotein beta-1,2-N-acetylglucosaminyltransferase
MAGGHRRNKKSNGRWGIDRKALCALCVLAWAWILGFVGVVIWHLRISKDAVGHDLRNLIHDASERHTDGSQHNSLRMELAHVLGQLLPQASKTYKAADYESPLLIFTCSRANYLSETLTDIYKYIPKPCQFGCPIIISQDGNNPEVTQVIKDFQKKFENKGVPLLHIHHPRPSSHVRKPMYEYAYENSSYQALAKHYGWALKSLFEEQIEGLPTAPQRVVILEEDLHIAPDFFEYFQATSKILDEDPSLFAVSAFNDNGHMVKDPTRLLRSDFFPGLGWMMTRRLWVDELDSKWPKDYWDDWLREPAQRQDRQVIRPEVSRTYHFGTEGGASGNQFGSILESVILDTRVVDWKHQDLSYLYETAYNVQYAELIKSSRLVSTWEEAQEALNTADVRLEYQRYKDFQKLAQIINIMDDEKAMVPRTAYNGVVEIRPVGEHLLLLTPPMTQLKEDFPTLG